MVSPRHKAMVWVRHKGAVMKLLQGSFLLLGAVILTGGQLFPNPARWASPRAPRMFGSQPPGVYYPQNQGQASLPPGSWTTAQDINRNAAPRSFRYYPRGFGQKLPESPLDPLKASVENHGMTPVLHHVEDYATKPAHKPVLDHVHHPAAHHVHHPTEHHEHKPEPGHVWEPMHHPAEHHEHKPEPGHVWEPMHHPAEHHEHKPELGHVWEPMHHHAEHHVKHHEHKPEPSHAWEPMHYPAAHHVLTPVLTPGQGHVLQPVEHNVPMPVHSYVQDPVQSPALTDLQSGSLDQMPVPVKYPVLTSGIMPVSSPVWDPVQDPMSVPAQNPAQEGALNPPVWSLVQTPVPAPVNKPVLTQVHEPDQVQEPLAPPAQIPVATSNLNTVPFWDPVLTSGITPALAPQLLPDLLKQDSGALNPPVWSLVQTPVLAPVHKPVLAPVWDPAQDPQPVPDQNHAQEGAPNSAVWNLVQTPVPAPVHKPVLTPVHEPDQVQQPPPAATSTLYPAHAWYPVESSTQGTTQKLSAQDQDHAPSLNPALTSDLVSVLHNLSLTQWSPVGTPAQVPSGKPAPVFSPVLYQDLHKGLSTKIYLDPKPTKKLLWRFPKVPERPQQPPVHFDLQQPTPANSVAAACGESVVHVEVKQDFFGTGHLVSPKALHLGKCEATAVDSAARVLIFHTELQACGSVLTMTEDSLIYNFNLLYNPEPIAGTAIVRSGTVNVHIECHYSRKQNVSSNAVAPTWVPYSSTVAAEEHLVFTLKLMTDDWKHERPSNTYFLGDFMKIEASLMQYNHVPLRVFVDRCVATAVPQVNAVPRYSFIENHGCLIDAKITGSNSYFMNRVHGDKLQFQLEVFRFEQSNSSSLYLTCLLRGSAASHPTDAEHKACSYTSNGWDAADDDDHVCSCCESGCSSRKGRSVPTDEDLLFESEVSLGPILVEDKDHLLK